ncbi:MAG: chromosome partitioning protein [Paraburkholderia sp.]|uniref:ParA family protein n=1 Tax=Paraburkholderia sp. TaxID=1926495 RepID=UPI00120DADC2|nr:AAA family ATPase [Paraburkholderia sp.]TAM06374.1 MAG: chromosome partitioning protein [Paraburkholderia sp.]
MAIKELSPPRKAIGLQQLIAIADRAEATLAQLRDDLLEPWPRKMPPAITASRLGKLCKLERTQIQYLCTRGNKGEYPTGTVTGGRNREFSLGEAQQFIRAVGPYRPRPPGAKGIAFAIANFKGGVGKTTNSVAIAQGLTLHGHKVLLIDLDPQASTTTLMGYVPTPEVTQEMTVMPLVFEEEPDLSYAIIHSYWDNLDFIPASTTLFGADFYLPSRQAKDPGYQFWAVLERAMEPLREQYDVIVIDTPPSLAYLATSCFMSSDGLVVPLPPETLDYASCASFFRQFADLFQSLQDERAVEKEFAFINIFLSKVKPRVGSSDVVRSWIQQTYPELLGRAEIPDNDLVKNAAAEFKTVYDLSRHEGSGVGLQTFNRALEAFDALVDEIEGQIQNAWALQLVKDGRNGNQ